MAGRLHLRNLRENQGLLPGSLGDIADDMPWTTEQAREMSRKGAERSRVVRAERKAEELANPPTAKAEPVTDGQSAAIQEARAREVIELLREQIALTRADLRKKMEPRDRAQLLGALDRLLERERVWSQRPAAANLRPASPRRQPGWSDPQPAPIPAAAAPPTPPTGSISPAPLTPAPSTPGASPS